MCSYFRVSYEFPQVCTKNRQTIKARKITKELGIKTEKQWHEAYRNGKIPKDIPQYLSQAYDPNLKRNKDRKLS